MIHKNISEINPDIKEAVQDILDREINSGLLTEYARKYPNGMIRWNLMTMQGDINLSGFFCNEQGEPVRGFSISGNLNFKLSLTIIKS